MLVVEQQFCVCIKEIIRRKPYGAKSVRKSVEYYDVTMTLTTLLILFKVLLILVIDI